MHLERVRKRRDFLHILKQGKKFYTDSFILQASAALNKEFKDKPVPRVGFVITKKIGNSVVRNLVRRRLKAALWNYMKDQTVLSLDYTIVAKSNILNTSFSQIENLIKWSFKNIQKNYLAL